MIDLWEHRREGLAMVRISILFFWYKDKEAIKAMEILRTPDDRFTDLSDYPFEPHYIHRQIVLLYE